MAFDSDELWVEVVRDVVPLKKEEKESGRKARKISITPKMSKNIVYHGKKLDDLEIGKADNIDANTAKKFRNGGFRIEACLDLHGCTEEVAFEKVIKFVKNAYIDGKRCIAIITGKGLHVEKIYGFSEVRGVLKNRVPQWLNLPEIRSLILAINHPLPKNGGSGVIRLLLKRKRNYENSSSKAL